jgi:hypothetical protein
MSHPVIETVEEISHNRLDNCHVVLLTGEGLDRVNRVPDGRYDYLSFVFDWAYEYLGTEETRHRAQVWQHGLRKVVVTVVLDAVGGSISLPDANDSGSHAGHAIDPAEQASVYRRRR